MKLFQLLPLLAPLRVSSKTLLQRNEPIADQQQPSSQRQLVSFEAVAGYQPKSLITDEAAIDLDQKKLEDIIRHTKSFTHALPVYTQGGHSDSYAVLEVRTKSSVAIDEGQQLFGKNEDGSTVHGTVRTSLTTFPSSIAGSGRGSLLSVNYDVNTVQGDNVGCQVGALGLLGQADTSGCFKAKGSLTFTGQATSFATYTYNVTTGNKNGRTLQSFSTNAEALMWNCSGGCPYDDFRKYVTYYGVPNYGDQFIQAAFRGKSTNFPNGDANFALNYTRGGRGEAITSGALLMNTWMMVVQEMEAAIDSCVDFGSCPTCIYDSIHHWDTAAAYYIGSQQGKDGSGTGHLLYQKANDLCQDFRTCGPSANAASGVAAVNVEIISEFESGQESLAERKCSNVRSTKEKIVKLMTVPLIQGTLLNAYIQEQQALFFDVEKAEIQGATFAAAVLPIVHNCSQEDAAIIYSYMAVGSSQNVSYVSVKRAFENNYACMGISCGQVGGFWLQVGEYGVNAAPCGGGDLSKKQRLGIGLGTVSGFLFILLCLAVYLRFFRKRKEVEYAGNDIIMPTDVRDAPTVPPAIT